MNGIYKITNSLNEKVYVGQTTTSLKKRFHGHCYDDAKNPINLAIKKYGKDNFKIELLEEVLTKDLDSKEQFYIKTLNTLSPNGYNLRTGGHTGYKFTDEVKLKISKSKMGKKTKRIYHALSNNTKYDISRSLNGKNIQATNLKTNEITIFVSSHSASKFGFQPWNIIACCKGKRKSHKGFQFIYANTEINSSVIPTIIVERSDEPVKTEYKSPRVSNTL